MSGEDLKTLQRNIQQLMSQSPSIAQLQMQLAQGQLGIGVSTGESLPQPVGEQYLVFSLGDRELGVKAEQVQGVERLGDLTPVPNVVAWVKGIMNLRGSIASVVDLRLFLDLEPIPPTPRTRLLSLQYNEMVICFVVDNVSEMLPVPAHIVINGNTRQANIPPWAAPYATGSALLANRTIVLLDVARLLFSEKMQRYEALG